MTSGLTLQQLFSELGIDQFLVPEIQRDYVWETSHLNALLASVLVAWKKYKHEPDLTISGHDADAQVERSFIEYYRRQRYSHHLGFIYAYHDSAYSGKAFLIDGQQRLVSLYLLLLAQAVKEGVQDDFRERYLLNRRDVRLDYRVREATHEFFPLFVELALTLPPGADIKAAVEAQYWYFKAYAQDVTIIHIVDNYAHLAQVVAQYEPDYYYLNNFVRFWYFDTGDSARGEDLYLSLNSTGLITSAGENQRAYLLGTDPDAKTTERKKYWGERLERWQDFFWKSRDQNSNADRGMNEFFRWVRALGPVIAKQACSTTDQQLTEMQQALKAARWSHNDQAVPGFTLLSAERLMQALQVLFPIVAGKVTEKVKGLNAAWLAPTKDTLSLAEMFRLLPTLAYCVARLDNPVTEQWTHLRRVVRYFFNLNRLLDISNAEEAARLTARAIQAAYQVGQTEAGDPISLLGLLSRGSALLPEEEADKLTLYGDADSDRSALEAALWLLEDDYWNAGEVQHLFVVKPLRSCNLQDVQLVAQRYSDLGLTEWSTKQTVLSLLLLYGNARVQNKYSGLYTQYDYGDWKRIVRNHGGIFEKLFREFLTAADTLEEFYQKKRCAYYTKHTISSLLTDTSFENQLRVLAVVCDRLQELETDGQETVTLWGHGGSIGYFYEDEPKDDELLFGEETLRFWNTEDRLTSAYWRKTNVSRKSYEQFLHLLSNVTSYRQFVESALIAAGAREEAPMISQEA